MPESGSVAVTVVTAVVFSRIVTAAVAPPPFDVIRGGSFTFVTLTVTAFSLLLPTASVATTVNV